MYREIGKSALEVGLNDSLFDSLTSFHLFLSPLSL